MSASQDHLDARQQLDGLKGLDDVVLRSQPQALDLVGYVLQGRQENDRRLLVAHLLHHRKAVGRPAA